MQNNRFQQNQGSQMPPTASPGQSGYNEAGGMQGADTGAMEGMNREETLTTQQMIDAFSKTMGAEAQGISEEQEFRIRQEARNMITDLQSSISDSLPDATRSQVNAAVSGWVENDPERVINAIRDAIKVETDKQSNAYRTGSRDLRVQGGGNGKAGQKPAPRSMNEAIVSASNMFGG